MKLSPIFLILPLALALPPAAQADPMPVHAVQGTLHGFLELRSEDGKIVASGDTYQTVRGTRVTSRTLFRFKDGSTDEETTIYTQRGTFRLVSDHHIQKGPSFPTPTDMLVDVPTGQVTVRTTGKDGKEDVKTDHINLPPDISNGLIPILVQNIGPKAEPTTTVTMIVATPKPRLVKLVISNVGEDKPLVAGSSRKAIHYNIKIELGGVIGVVAPIVGKAPPDIQIWTIPGEATTFAKEIGPLYAEGPLMTIQLASPTWPDSSKPTH